MLNRPRLLCLIAALCASTSAAFAQGTVLVPAGSDWRFKDDGVPPDPSWIDPSFDDSAWGQGPAQLGYGDGDEATIVSYGPDPSARHITTWFRHSFQVADPSEILGLRLRLLRDDGAAVYLNGAELTRQRLSWFFNTPTSLADGEAHPPEESTFQVESFGNPPLVSGTNVLAVELHQAAIDSDDLSFDLELIGLEHGVLTRGPYLQAGSSTEVTVRWTTSTPEPTRLSVGSTPTMAQVPIGDPTPKLDHEVHLTGLLPGTRYWYQINGASHRYAGGPDLFFRTAPETGSREPLTFWVIGDSGTANSRARMVRDEYLAQYGPRPSCWIMLGDNAYPTGTYEQYDRAVFDTYQTLLARSVVWSTRGNHDEDLNAYEDLFTLPTQGENGGVPSGSELYYSFNWGNVHFVCLDSFETSRAPGDPMHSWLQADLAAADADWLVAFWHHPAYSMGTHNSDADLEMREMREVFVPLLEEYGVDLVLAGHSHGYERSMLLDGHYGLSTSFDPGEHAVDPGDGDPESDGPYVRVTAPHQGAVYAVAGCAGDVRQATYDHPVMVTAGPMMGSVVLEVEGGRLDYTFLDDLGVVRDRFRLVDETYTGPTCIGDLHGGGCRVELDVQGNPSVAGNAPLDLLASATPPGTTGLLTYGIGPLAQPTLGGGRLCAAAPLRRLPAQQASVGAGGPCDGSLQFDLRSWLQGPQDPALLPGVTMYLQVWFRDPLSPFEASFSGAYQLVLEP